jgi:hypothetical protein
MLSKPKFSLKISITNLNQPESHFEKKVTNKKKGAEILD